MRIVRDYLKELIQATALNWNRFWFTPADSATLGLIRILAGAMMVYTQLVWCLDLSAFFGTHSWLNDDAVALLQRDGWQWSFLWWCESPVLMWCVHLASLLVCSLLMLGLWTPVVSVLACVMLLAYAHRTPEALYGLDQISGFLSLYLAVGPSGAAYSMDRWLAARRTGSRLGPPRPSIRANIAIRLIQWQLCVLYLFAGLSKLQGPAWWDGTAFWGAVANLEYQSVDLLWLVHYPWLVNLLTHVTVAWEIAYIALIWDRLTRPLMLLLAVFVHLGIGVCLGMMTFGSVMLIANLAFVSPVLVRLILDRKPTDRVANSNSHALTGPKWQMAPAVHSAGGGKRRPQ